VTFGIVPSAPETGYGYIRKGPELVDADPDLYASEISRFVEKPDLQTAQSYVASGEYLWNSGMFMFQAPIRLGRNGTIRSRDTQCLPPGS
jgi:Mannose-1-phosphate guanylyltransferase